MSEEPAEAGDHDDPDVERIAIPVPMPPSLARLMAHAARHDDHHEMERDAMEAQIYAFLDSLSVDHALALRHMLNMTQTSPINQYFDGQVVGLLRYVHHVNPDSGKSVTEELGDAAAPVEPTP